MKACLRVYEVTARPLLMALGGLIKQRLQLTALVHAHQDVAASHKLPIDEDLHASEPGWYEELLERWALWLRKAQELLCVKIWYICPCTACY